jgi:succinate dehydrogenase / fumarate reductase, membrane anchor subunit
MVEREVVGAHYGWRDWLLQRLTAAVMLLYTLFFVGVLVTLPNVDYVHWRALWQLPLMRYATLLFVIATLLHAWIGVRNIFMDYVKDTGVRLTLYVLAVLALVVYGLWALQILWSA